MLLRPEDRSCFHCGRPWPLDGMVGGWSYGPPGAYITTFQLMCPDFPRCEKEKSDMTLEEAAARYDRARKALEEAAGMEKEMEEATERCVTRRHAATREYNEARDALMEAASPGEWQLRR